MELIRLLLLEQEKGEALPEVSNYPEETQLYHFKLAADSDLIEASFIPEIGIPKSVKIHRITWAGHDFLDSARDSKIWKMALDQIIKPGASWSFSILVEWLKREAHQRVFGVPASSCDSTLPHIE